MIDIEKVKYLIKLSKYSNDDIAKEANVASGSVSAMKSGNMKPNLKLAIFFFKVFPDLNPQWLFFDKGEMFGSAADGAGKDVGALEKEVAELKKKLKDYDEVKATVMEIQKHFKIIMAELEGKEKA